MVREAAHHRVRNVAAERSNKHALGRKCNALHFVAFGIVRRLHDGWLHSCPAGHRHHSGDGPVYSGTQMAAMIWAFAGEGAVSGKEVNKMAKDPVCGMEKDEKKAPARSRHAEGEEIRSSSC